MELELFVREVVARMDEARAVVAGEQDPGVRALLAVSLATSMVTSGLPAEAALQALRGVAVDIAKRERDAKKKDGN